jgi:hypothetical protein
MAPTPTLTLPRPLLTLRLARAWAQDRIWREWKNMSVVTEIVLTLALPAVVNAEPDVVALLAEVPHDHCARYWETGVHDPVAGTLTWRLRDGMETRVVRWELRISMHESVACGLAAWAIVYDPELDRPACGQGEDVGLLQWDARRDIINQAYGRSDVMTRIL